MGAKTKWSQGLESRSHNWSTDRIRAALRCDIGEYDQIQDLLGTAMQREGLMEAHLRGSELQRLSSLFKAALRPLQHRQSLLASATASQTRKALTELAKKIKVAAKGNYRAKSHEQRATIESSRNVVDLHAADASLVPAISSSSPQSTNDALSKPPVTKTSYQPKLKDVLILAIRGDNKTSACFLREVVQEGKSEVLLDAGHLSFNIWKLILREDGMISTKPTESANTAIFWTMGERRVQVSNDRQFRVGIIYMATHQDQIVFNIEKGQPGTPNNTAIGWR